MAQVKTVKTRIQHKHDIEANWIKATNFVPLAGELIIYDAETNSTDLTGTGRTTPITHTRFKFGNGTDKVTDLAFSASPVDWNQNDPQASDYIKNRTHYDGTQIFYLENIDEYIFNFDALVTADCYLMPGTYTVSNWDGLLGSGRSITETVQEGEKKRTILDGKVKLEVQTKEGMPSEAIGFYVGAPDGGKATLEVTSLPKQLDTKYIPIDNETIITENGILKTGAIHKGYTQGSVQAGNNASAGCKGWYIVGLSSDYKSVVLDCSNGVNHASGNIYEILDDLTSSEFYDSGESTGYEAGDIVTIFNDKHYAYCNTIASVNHNVIYFTERLPFTKLIAEGVSGRVYEADHVLYVPAKPDCGYIITYEEDGTSHEMFEGAFAFGNGSVAAAEDGFAAGQNNVVIDDHGAVFGRNNISGYANIVGGGWNSSVGQHSFVLGRNLTNTGNQNIVGGRYSTVGGTGHVVTGYRQTVTGELNAVFGGSSTEGEGNVVSGSANLVAGRKNTVQGTGQFVSGSTNVANGNFNVVGGELNNTNGQRDVLLIGKGLAANGYYQILGGRFNDVNDKLNIANPVLMVGGGTSDTARKTVFAVGLDGEVASTSTISTTASISAGNNIEATNNITAGKTIKGVTLYSTGNTSVDGDMKVKGILRTWSGLRVGGDNNVNIGGQNSLNIGVGSNININSATKSVVVGEDIVASGKGQFIIGENYYGKPETISGNFNFIHGDTSNCSVTGNYNALLGSGGNNTIKTQHNLVVGAGHTVDGILHETGEANLLVGVSHDVNNVNYSGYIGRKLTATNDCQLVVGKFNDPDADGVFIVGGGSPGTTKTYYVSTPEYFNDTTYKTDKLTIVFPTTNKDKYTYSFEKDQGGPEWNDLSAGVIRWDGTSWIFDCEYDYSYLGDALIITDAEFTLFLDQERDAASYIVTEKFIGVRKNLLTVDKTGETTIDGDINVSGQLILNGTIHIPNYSPEVSDDIATKGYVDDVHNTLFDENSKVKASLLPDAILGQMKYGGIINAIDENDYLGITPSHMLSDYIKQNSEVVDLISSVSIVPGLTCEITGRGYDKDDNDAYFDLTIPEGYYFISNIDIPKEIMPDRTDDEEQVLTGDWLVVCGNMWETVGNTDTVRTVNGKIGDVQLDAEAVGAYSKEYVDKLESRISELETIINSITTLGITKNDNGQLTITE